MSGKNEDLSNERGDEVVDKTSEGISVSSTKPGETEIVGDFGEALQGRLDKMEDRQLKLDRNTDEISKDVTNLNQKIEERDRHTIETIGIFVALFTFISIEFQLFRSLTSVAAVFGLTLVIFGALLAFVLLLKNFQGKQAWIWAFPVVSMMVGGYFFWTGQQNDIIPEIIEKEVQKRFQTIDVNMNDIEEKLMELTSTDLTKFPAKMKTKWKR